MGRFKAPTSSSPLHSDTQDKHTAQTWMREMTCTQNAHEELPAFVSIEQTLQRARHAPEQLLRLSDIFISSHPSVPRPLSVFLSLLISSLFFLCLFFSSLTPGHVNESHGDPFGRGCDADRKRHVCGRGRGISWEVAMASQNNSSELGAVKTERVSVLLLLLTTKLLRVFCRSKLCTLFSKGSPPPNHLHHLHPLLPLVFLPCKCVSCKCLYAMVDKSGARPQGTGVEEWRRMERGQSHPAEGEHKPSSPLRTDAGDVVFWVAVCHATSHPSSFSSSSPSSSSLTLDALGVKRGTMTKYSVVEKLQNILCVWIWLLIKIVPQAAKDTVKTSYGK